MIRQMRPTTYCSISGPLRVSTPPDHEGTADTFRVQRATGTFPPGVTIWGVHRLRLEEARILVETIFETERTLELVTEIELRSSGQRLFYADRGYNRDILHPFSLDLRIYLTARCEVTRPLRLFEPCVDLRIVIMRVIPHAGRLSHDERGVINSLELDPCIGVAYVADEKDRIHIL